MITQLWYDKTEVTLRKDNFPWEQKIVIFTRPCLQLWCCQAEIYCGKNLAAIEKYEKGKETLNGMKVRLKAFLHVWNIKGSMWKWWCGGENLARVGWLAGARGRPWVALRSCGSSSPVEPLAWYRGARTARFTARQKASTVCTLSPGGRISTQVSAL